MEFLKSGPSGIVKLIHAPTHMVSKENDNWKLYKNYSALNSQTYADQRLVLYICIFSTIHLVSALNQIPIADEGITKTVIITSFGLYEFLFTAFGLRYTAQPRFVNEALRGLDFRYAQINDISVASSSFEENINH